MNARPKKSFGQHFLHEKRYIERIVSSISPKPADVVVEIGPGEGALTLPLLAAAGKLTAIELDTDLIPDLQARAAAVGELRIVHSDVLKVDFTALARELGAERLRIAGNLPYYISSPILFHCVEHAAAIQDMHFMLQKEVVDRMAAEPGSKVYGRLSVMLQLACQVVPLPAEQRHDADPDRVHAIVKAAFAQRRKTLSNALRQLLDAAAIESAGIDPKARAETLAPLDFVRLAKLPTQV